MPVPIETYILINLVMNFAIIATVARSRGRVAWRRVAFASAFGAIYAVAMKCGWFPQLNAAAAKLFLAAATSLVAFGPDGARTLISGTLALIGATVFVGGVVSLTLRLFGRTAFTFALGTVAGASSLAAVLAIRESRPCKPEARVSIGFGGEKTELRAMIDTGNRLREPISGLPVLIVEYRAVKKMLPAELDAERPCQTLPADFRLASFDSLGSRGVMALFKPEELLVSYGEGWLGAQDIWVGVYPGSIPGTYRAIAPAVIGRIRQTSGGIAKINHIEGSCKIWKIPRNRQ